MKKLILLTLLLLLPNIAKADYISAVKSYRDNNYAKAYEEFFIMARLGEKRSQFNLGLMYYQGQFVPKDIYQSYAWLKLATDNRLTNHSELKVFYRVKSEVKNAALAEKTYQATKRRYSRQSNIEKILNY